MTPELQQLLQIGIVVRDVDQAVRYYEDVLEMGPWNVSYMRGDEPPTEDLVVDGKPMPYIVNKLAFLNAYGIELELIEPVADTPFKKWLDEHGPASTTLPRSPGHPTRSYSSPTGSPPGRRFGAVGRAWAA